MGLMDALTCFAGNVRGTLRWLDEVYGSFCLLLCCQHFQLLPDIVLILPVPSGPPAASSACSWYIHLTLV